MMRMLDYTGEDGTFRLENAQQAGSLYFPLMNEAGIISSITPSLGGDCKTGQNTWLLAPCSDETLHESRATRNFWCVAKGFAPWSATGESARQRAARFGKDEEKATVEGGLLWHRATRENAAMGLRAAVLSFVPAGQRTVELMQITLTNTGTAPLRLTPTAAIPLYGRSADNIRDHRHVTSLLQCMRAETYGLVLHPTLTFDERGHRPGAVRYSVLGAEEEGIAPEGFLGTVRQFVGEGASYDWPRAVVTGEVSYCPPGSCWEGSEMIAALRCALLQ